ncbi:Lipopolysaccharide-induced tumor necrosis factor-alpha factor-like protein, partial [Ooceraea biroi]
PVATICPRCAALVITVVTVRRSTITHLTALTLFLFGCWPCCLIPYCVDSYTNTDHYCPICRTYLGTYTP